MIRQRRRLMPTPEEPVETVPEPPAIVPAERALNLQASLAAARAATKQHQRDFETLVRDTQALRQRTVELRAGRAEHIERLRAAASQRRER